MKIISTIQAKQKNRKSLILLTVAVVGVLGVALISLQGDQGKPAEVTPTPQQSSNPIIQLSSSPLGFGQVLTTPPMSIQVDVKPSVPRTIRLYPILPAPFGYFSVEAVQTVAQKLGFSEAAQATQKSGLYIYREGGRTLIINPEAGIIQFTAIQVTSGNQHLTPDINTARTKIKALMQALNLDLPIVNWSGAEFNETGMLVPLLEVAGVPLIPPLDYYARFDGDGNIVGFSYWLPNLDYDNVIAAEVISPNAAAAKVAAGEAVVMRGLEQQLSNLTINNLFLSYLIRPEAIYNLGTSQTLQPVYVFENEDVTLYVNAVGASNQ